MAKHRDRRDHRSEWSDERPDDFQEPSFFRQQRAVSPGRPAVSRGSGVDAVVLWFNADKGFGFVQTPLVARQSCTHGSLRPRVIQPLSMARTSRSFSRLETRDRKSLPCWKLERCPSSNRRDGRRHAMTLQPAKVQEPSSSTMPTRALVLSAWPPEERTFSFMHQPCLVRGLTTLEQEQLVKVSYAQGAKGLKARTVWLD